MSFFFLTVAGLAEFIAGRYEEAVIWLRRGAARETRASRRCAGSSRRPLALLGRDDEAKVAAARPPGNGPRSFRVSVFASWYPLRRLDDLERLAAGLRLAGLPA